MLVTSIFYFSHNVISTHPKTNFLFFSYICSAVWKYFQFGPVFDFVIWYTVNSLPDNKIWGLTKLKAFADDKSNVAKMMISLFDRVENFVEKEKMLINIIFSFFLNVFKMPLIQGC